MIITDVHDEKLTLSKHRLTEVTGAWYLLLKDIPEKITGFTRVAIIKRGHSKIHMQVFMARWSTNPLRYRIGCHWFDKKTFATILKAGKEARKHAAAKR